MSTFQCYSCESSGTSHFSAPVTRGFTLKAFKLPVGLLALRLVNSSTVTAQQTLVDLKYPKFQIFECIELSLHVLCEFFFRLK